MTLTKSQFDELNKLCKTFSAESFPQDHDGYIRDGVPRICLDTISVTVYENRCMESMLSCQLVCLGGLYDARGPSDQEKQRVKGILKEPDDSDYYTNGKSMKASLFCTPCE